MAEEKTKTEKAKSNVECNDKLCPFHGQMSLRGRSFRGTVIRKFPKRIVIEFERTLFIAKYERYSKYPLSYLQSPTILIRYSLIVPSPK